MEGNKRTQFDQTRCRQVFVQHGIDKSLVHVQTVSKGFILNILKTSLNKHFIIDIFLKDSLDKFFT